jgi:exopolysaccharide production protein ExoZ
MENMKPAPPARSTIFARSSSELLSIQYLRAAAALGVLFYHAAARANLSFSMGAAGVDVFFVISGLVMFVISTQREITPTKFLLRRATRIIPLYWSVSLAIAVIAASIPGSFPNADVSADHVLKSLFFYPHFDRSGLMAPLLIPGWTLNYEMFFYIIFAITLFSPPRLRIAILVVILGSCVAIGSVVRPTVPIWSVYTNPLLLEFLAGTLLGKAWTTFRFSNRPIGLMAMALALAVLVIVDFAAIDVEPVRIVAWGIPAGLIVAGALCFERTLKYIPVLKFMGDASYSLYLVHGLAVSAAARLLAAVDVNSKPALFVAAVLFGLGAGSVCYMVVERPLLHLLHRSRRAAPMLSSSA